MLRRRRMLQLGGRDVYEVKLGSVFPYVQLSRLALGLLDKGVIDVVVGGLGLGYTAVSALEDRRVKSLVVVEYLAGVIEWHQNGLVPLGRRLTGDSRCRLVHADFFALSRDVTKSFDPENPQSKHDAILVDIDHTPTNVLLRTNTRF